MAKVKVYNGSTFCAELIYRQKGQDVQIINHITEPLIHLPFGLRNRVSWDVFFSYMTSRCFPEERRNKKDLLKSLGLAEYDPFEIVKKTQGRMAEDNTWLEIEE